MEPRALTSRHTEVTRQRLASLGDRGLQFLRTSGACSREHGPRRAGPLGSSGSGHPRRPRAPRHERLLCVRPGDVESPLVGPCPSVGADGCPATISRRGVKARMSFASTNTRRWSAGLGRLRSSATPETDLAISCACRGVAPDAGKIYLIFPSI